MHSLANVMYSPAVWGKDHFAALRFIEYICVDCRGKLKFDDPRMRLARLPDGLPPNALTILLNGVKSEDERHDDWSCTNDLIKHGLVIENESGALEYNLALTDYGWRVAGALRRWIAENRTYTGFVMPSVRAEEAR